MGIYKELRKDHREIKAMLTELVSLHRKDDYRLLLMAEVRNAVSAHARAEEAVFYYLLKEADARASKAALKGIKEHIEIETVLWALEVVERLGGNWKPLSKKLLAMVEENIRTEEQEVFALAKSRFRQKEAAKMGKAYRRIKPGIEQRGELRSTMKMLLGLFPPKLAAVLGGAL